MSAMIRSIWEESERGKIAVNVSKAIFDTLVNILWRILSRNKFSHGDLGDDDKGFADLVKQVSTAVGGLNIGDFIPCLDWLDLQGIKRSLKEANKRFVAFAEKMIDEHLEYRMTPTTGTDAELHVKDFVDVLLDIAETGNTETKITRETIKSVIYVCLSCYLSLPFYSSFDLLCRFASLHTIFFLLEDIVLVKEAMHSHLYKIRVCLTDWFLLKILESKKLLSCSKIRVCLTI